MEPEASLFYGTMESMRLVSSEEQRPQRRNVKSFKAKMSWGLGSFGRDTRLDVVGYGREVEKRRGDWCGRVEQAWVLRREVRFVVYARGQRHRTPFQHRPSGKPEIFAEMRIFFRMPESVPRPCRT